MPPESWLTASTIALALIIMTAAGVLKGCVGFGAPLVAVPLMAMLVGSKPAVILMSIPLFVTNASILLTQRPQAQVARRFTPIVVALVPATFGGGLLLAGMDTRAVAIVVGLVALAFSALSFAGFQPSPPHWAERTVSLLFGGLAGLLNGWTSIPGPLFAIYLSTLGLEKRAFVYGITLLLLAANVFQVLTYLRLDLFAGGLLVASAALAPALLLGQQIGSRIQNRLDPVRFTRVVLAVVALSGANLLARGLGLL